MVKPVVPPGAPDADTVESCRRCELWSQATHGVPGEGPRKALIMLVGEQPGDAEDLAGRPFVGPAGMLLRGVLQEAGLDEDELFLTNAVKHFRWEPRGKRRIHKTPAQRHIAACELWLTQEIATVRPRVLVALGATALLALTGRRITLAEAREGVQPHPSGAALIATYHPSAVLRAPDPEVRAQLRALLKQDLRKAARLARKGLDRT
jgi:DNA polymerase